MGNISNEQLSNQIAKLDAKLEVLMYLLERNEKTMFSFFGNQGKLRENLARIGYVYKDTRQELQNCYERIDKLYEDVDNGSGEL